MAGLRKILILAFVSLALWPSVLLAQSTNATISGTVADPSGALIPGAEVKLRHMLSGAVMTVTTGSDGSYSFANLVEGEYRLECEAKGFQTFVQNGIILQLNATARIPIELTIGSSSQTVQVTANASQVNYDNAVVKEGIAANEVANLPIIASGSQRSAAYFVRILPGVTSQGSPVSSTGVTGPLFNGNEQYSDASTLDGVSMQEGLLNSAGIESIGHDFPIGPDAVGEISVLTQNYDPQYGGTTGAVTVISTKAGTDQFHGGGYEFNRNTDFNARPFGVASRPVDTENDGGGYIGGPIKFLPKFWSGRKKSYFFVNFEFYRSRGAATKPLLTVPTTLMREGNFSEWPYPIYDPTTTASNPAYNPSQPTGPSNLPYLRTQFPGNVIPQSAMAGSLAQGWLQWVPLPNRPGLTANYESPIGVANLENPLSDQWDVRGDQYIGDKDHVSLTEHYRGTLPFVQHEFPAQIDTLNSRIPQYGNVARINWDHIFSPRVVNHLGLGYLNMLSTLYNSSDCCVSKVPEIAGVYSHAHEPVINFQEFNSYGGNTVDSSTRPNFSINDMVTWVRGTHTFTYGGEWKWLGFPYMRETNASGTFNFSDLNTGLLGIPSGNSMASFLLGDVSYGSAEFFSAPFSDELNQAFGAFFGDTWKARQKLSIDYGIRWDLYQPSMERHDMMSFFDPNAENPGAGDRLGALMFAGNKWGSASFGARYPERLFYGAFGPRIGVAYALTPKTVIRAGAGIFFMEDYYPGWGSSTATDGFNKTVAFTSSLGGMQPAFMLQDGLPQNFQRPPVIDRSYDNGSAAPLYRPFNGNQVPRSEQWNLTVDHQFSANFHLSAAYVANHGSRLLSQMEGLNTLSPAMLSMGEALYDVFQPGQTSLDGVNAPYSGWAAQMTGCAPSVAQALTLYPQYCGGIYGLNENAGWSNYNSLQITAEKRYSKGLLFNINYTWSKWLSTSDSVGGGVSPISPYQLDRNYSISANDIPQVFNASVVYRLPVGKGERFMNAGGVLSAVLGGWQISTILTLQSGLPFSFTSSYCNVPSQFGIGCLPSILTGTNPLSQGKSSYDPGKGPLFNGNAFEPASSFDFYSGQGPRVSNIRGFGLNDEDFSLSKRVNVTERLKVEIRGEFFNAYNWHCFSEPGSFVTDVYSPSFGQWTGSVAPPRNIQVGIHLAF